MSKLLTRFERIEEFLLADRRSLLGIDDHDRRLAALGCLLVADPGGQALTQEFEQALEEGIHPKVLEAILIHAIGYLGVISVKPAFLILRNLIATADLNTSETVVDPDRQARVANGAKLYDRFDPGRQAAQAKIFQKLSSAYYPAAMELAGLTLTAEELILRERQIVTIAILSCLGGQDAQLKFHLGVALRLGVEPKLIGAVFVLVEAYAGMPRANSAAMLAVRVLTETEDRN